MDPSGNPWVVNNLNNVWYHSGGSWIQLPGSGQDIGVGASGAAWVIGTDTEDGGYAIYYWNPSLNSWIQPPGGAIRVAVSPDGLPWVVNNAGSIFQGLHC